MATRRFTITFAIKNSPGQYLEGATVYLMPAGVTFDVGTAIELTEDGSRTGFYRHTAVEEGNYDVYIDQGGGAAVYEANISHGVQDGSVTPEKTSFGEAY